jgi:predicted DNA-binding transcriptional regulator YafY
VLRRAKRPLTADDIAAALETSKRTIYRDIAALMSQRVPIRGEAGIGYVLDRGYDLPPLMLTVDEAEAVALGCQWVAEHADDTLGRAAAAALAKLLAVVPAGLQATMQTPAVGTPPRWGVDQSDVDVARLREWSRAGRKLQIAYEDESGVVTERIVHPFLVGYTARVRVVIAWCALRDDFRVFRADRLRAVTFLDERYPEDPLELRARWLATKPAHR